MKSEKKRKTTSNLLQHIEEILLSKQIELEYRRERGYRWDEL